MSLVDLPADTINIICQNLGVDDIKKLFSVCKYLRWIASSPNITFDQHVKLSTIKKLSYYDNFSDIELDCDKNFFEYVSDPVKEDILSSFLSDKIILSLIHI